MKRELRRERLIFQAVVIGENLTNQEVARIANHERFKKKLFMVGDTCRVSVRRISDSASVFTVSNYYYIDDLSFGQRVRHLLGKLRTAAFLNMGISEVVVVVISDTGL